MRDGADVPSLAFVAGNIKAAWIEISAEYEVLDQIAPRRGIIVLDEKLVQFVIVTHPDHALGIRVRECRWLPCSALLHWRNSAQIRALLRAGMACIEPRLT